MKLDTLCTWIKDCRKNGSTYAEMAHSLNISKAMVRLIEQGHKPGPEVSAKLGLEPSAKLSYTRNRRKILNEIAQEWGYDNWSEYETDTIQEKEQRQGQWRENI